MDVSLTKELETYVAEKIRTDRCGIASAVVEDALRQKMEQDAAAFLRKRLEQPRRELADGRFVEANDEFFDILHKRIADIAASNPNNVKQ